jgi:hypothetical protein
MVGYIVAVWQCSCLHGLLSPSGINDAGQIVGDFSSQGFILSNGIFTYLNAPGAKYFTEGTAINDQGQAGVVADGRNLFLYSAGVYTTLDIPVPEICDCSISEINDEDEIVDGNCLYTGGNCTFLSPPRRATNLYLTGINDSGVVVGSYFATPEPSTWAMMLLGFAGLGYAGYRRAREPRAA